MKSELNRMQPILSKIGSDLQTKSLGMPAPSTPSILMKRKPLVSPTKPNTGYELTIEGQRKTCITEIPASGVDTKMKSNRDIVQPQTIFESADTSSEANLRSRIASFVRARSSMSSTVGGRKQGNISTSELVNILRHLGVPQVTTPEARFTTGLVQAVPKFPGILRGTGPTHGLLGKSGSPGSRSSGSGQLIRIIDNKRVLIDTKDTSISPVDHDQPSAIVSNNKIPVVISERLRPNEKTRSNIAENFIIVRPVGSVENKTTDQGVRTDVANQEVNLAADTTDKSVSSVQASSASPIPTIVKSNLTFSNIEAKVETVDKANAPSIVANQANVTADSAPSKNDITASEHLPDAYIQEIHEKFKQQRLKKEKGSPLEKKQAKDRSDLSTTPGFFEDTPQSIPAPVSVLSADVSMTPAPAVVTTPSITSAALSVPEKNAISEMPSDVISSKVDTEEQSMSTTSTSEPNVDTIPANAPPSADLQKTSDVISKLDSLLSEVQSNKEGHTSTDALSTRLLELAMQLRAPQAAKVSEAATLSLDSKSTPMSSDSRIAPVPSDSKSAPVASSSLDNTPVAMDLVPPEPVPEQLHEEGNVMPAEEQHKLEDIPTQSTFDDAQDFDRTSDQRSSIQNVDELARESYENCYNRFTPLSGFIQNTLRINSKVRDVMLSVHHGKDVVWTSEPSLKDKKEEEDSTSPQGTEVFGSTEQNSPEEATSSEQRLPETYQKTQKIAHVRPQQSASRSCPSFYVFNPRNDPECVRISLLLTLTGKPFAINNIANAVANSSPHDDGVLVPVTKEMIDQSLNDEELWIIIR